MTYVSNGNAAMRAIGRVLSNHTIPDGALRRELLVLMPSEHVLFPSRAAAVRWQLCEKPRHVRPLLKALLCLPFASEADSPLLVALVRLRELHAHRGRQLRDHIHASFAPRWADLIEGGDRQRALQAFEVATLFALRKALRNGSVWIAHSLAYRHRNEMLISEVEWEAQRHRFYQQLGLPLRASSYTPQLLANLEAGLASLAEAVEVGEVLVDDAGVHLQALEEEELPQALEPMKQALFQEVGVVQWPALLMAIDSETCFSWRLLGRAPTNDMELLSVYAALLAHRTELDAASVALMIPDLAETAIAEAMRLLKDEAALWEANAVVLEFLYRHAVVKVWGEGTFASADAINLEASRHLRNARVDPRRRTYAIGIYSHVLDLWGIIYDQPLVLHQRQAGAATEGIVRQTVATNMERLTVDTHGCTDVGMAISRLLGFDLCPRLSHLRDRRLYLPRELEVPTVLERVVERDVSWHQLDMRWDQLIRVTASIDGGWSSAVLALERFGAAARADSIHQAGSTLGKHLRNLFLCDYLSNSAFCREVLWILNHGESVHTLQRVLDTWHHAGVRRVDLDLLRHIGPVHFAGINFHGVFQFPLTRYRSRLIPAQ